MDSYLSSKIDAWSNTSIRDQKTKDFINSINSKYLRSIIREHFEHECYFRYYNIDDFKKEFIEYLNDKSINHYFLPGLNDHYEDILKKLLGIEKWNNKKERRVIR